jgi:HEAT repeat protein
VTGINVLLLTLVLSPDPDALERSLSETQRLSAAVEAALKDLERPAERVHQINEFVPSHLVSGLTPAGSSEGKPPAAPPAPEPELHLAFLVANCSGSINLLIKSTEPVDALLLHLAQQDPRLPTRVRAAHVLAARGHPLAGAVFEKLATSQSANERDLAWQAYAKAIREGWVPTPKDATFALQRFEAGERFWELPVILGYARARSAVPLLIARLKARSENEDTIVWALGAIGTPEAVTHLLSRLKAGSMEGTVTALGVSGSPAALPALTAHLTTLQKEPNPSKWAIAEVRVAILRVSREDPHDDLLRLAEDRQEEEVVRCRALEALSPRNLTGLLPRLLKLYSSERNVDLRLWCIRLLRNQEYSGITEAMLEHARNIGAEDRSTGGSSWELLPALNRRLGTNYGSLDELLKTRDSQHRGPNSP